MLENVPGYETRDAFVQNAKVSSIRGQTSSHICHNDTVHCLTVLCRDSIHWLSNPQKLLPNSNTSFPVLKDNYLVECTRNTRLLVLRTTPLHSCKDSATFSINFCTSMEPSREHRFSWGTHYKMNQLLRNIQRIHKNKRKCRLEGTSTKPFQFCFRIFSWVEWSTNYVQFLSKKRNYDSHKQSNAQSMEFTK